jgi:hypothetical protein
MKAFDDIKNHPSWATLPLNVRAVLTVCFRDPNMDLLVALRSVSPLAARASLDVQMDAVKKILSHPDVIILTAFWTFGIDLHSLRGVPDSPADVEVI